MLLAAIFPKKASTLVNSSLQWLAYLTCLGTIYKEFGFAIGIVICWEGCGGVQKCLVNILNVAAKRRVFREMTRLGCYENEDLRKRRPYITENRRNNKYKLNTH